MVVEEAPRVRRYESEEEEEEDDDEEEEDLQALNGQIVLSCPPSQKEPQRD